MKSRPTSLLVKWSAHSICHLSVQTPEQSTDDPYPRSVWQTTHKPLRLHTFLHNLTFKVFHENIILQVIERYKIMFFYNCLREYPVKK